MNGKYAVAAPRTIAATESAFHRALLASDLETLAEVLAENFVWTRSGGERLKRRQMLESLSSGQMKYSKLETRHIAISVDGDTGIARGIALQQRSSIPGQIAGETSPITSYYTMTFIRRNGSWKAVAMHSSHE